MTNDGVVDAASGWRARFASRHPRGYLALHAAVGVVATMLLLWLFLAIADEIPERGTLVRVDAFVAHWLDAHGTEWGERIFYWVSYLGAPVLVASVVLALVILWRRGERRDAVALALTSGLGVALSHVLKLVFHRGRPETAIEFIAGQSWSFPSGHAMNSMISYGFLTMLLLQRVADRRKRVAVVVAAVLLVGVIGFSRLYLGVHYLSDVGGGWIAGAAWLIVCISGYRVARRRAERGDG